MYKINAPKIIHETIDNETVIINTENGIYYNAIGYASIIWNAINCGHSISKISTAFNSLNIFDPQLKVVEKFILILIDEGLISKDSKKENPDEFLIDMRPDWQVPIISKYSDLQELIELDPIHEVNTEIGWPIQRKQKDISNE